LGLVDTGEPCGSASQQQRQRRCEEAITSAFVSICATVSTKDDPIVSLVPSVTCAVMDYLESVAATYKKITDRLPRCRVESLSACARVVTLALQNAYPDTQSLRLGADVYPNRNVDPNIYLYTSHGYETTVVGSQGCHKTKLGPGCTVVHISVTYSTIDVALLL
jgi:hypothetical protein